MIHSYQFLSYSKATVRKISVKCQWKDLFDKRHASISQSTVNVTEECLTNDTGINVFPQETKWTCILTIHKIETLAQSW